MDGDPRTMFSHEFKRGLETSQHCFGDELLLSLGIRGLELLYLVVFDDPAARVQSRDVVAKRRERWKRNEAGKELRSVLIIRAVEEYFLCTLLLGPLVVDLCNSGQAKTRNA